WAYQLWKEFQAIILEGYGDTMARLRGRFAYPLVYELPGKPILSTIYGLVDVALYYTDNNIPLQCCKERIYMREIESGDIGFYQCVFFVLFERMYSDAFSLAAFPCLMLKNDNLITHNTVIVMYKVQAVLKNGEAVLNKQVNHGNISGQNGFELVAFKPNKSPMKSQVAGYTSVFSTMPLGVLTNAYEISLSQSQNLKNNREIEDIKGKKCTHMYLHTQMKQFQATTEEGSLKECGDDDASKRCCNKGMVEVMEKLKSDNAKMMKLMKQISERN
ncbi:11S globulin precursor, partial [Tanacetum coccineum]